MERRKLQVATSDRMTNAEIKKTTNMKDIVAVTHSIKWNWGGHRQEWSEADGRKQRQCGM
jgi:hypothetical protein